MPNSPTLDQLRRWLGDSEDEHLEFKEAKTQFDKGLDTETNKALLLKHIERNKVAGSPLRDLQEVLPAEGRKHIQYLLTEMKEAELVHARGRTRAARWFPGAGDEPGVGHL